MKLTPVHDFETHFAKVAELFTATPTPEELAAQFGAMEASDQAAFFSALHTHICETYSSKMYGFSIQMERVRGKLTPDAHAAAVMRIIGGNY